MAETLFITGTDTGVGKTFVSVALLRAARGAGIDVCGYKPVASGCERTRDGLRNEDALALQAAAPGEDYSAINPYAFEPAIAPHLAAASVNQPIERARLDAAHAALVARHDWLIVEGAGGWHTPLDAGSTFADWVGERRWPVLLVVSLRLGCLNHALLSAEAILRRTRLLGWVANVLPSAMAQPMDWLEENIADLERRLPAPQLARFGEDRAANHSNATQLLGALDRSRRLHAGRC